MQNLPVYNFQVLSFILKGKKLARMARTGPINNPAQMNRPKIPRIAIVTLAFISLPLTAFIETYNIANPAIMGSKAKITVITTDDGISVCPNAIPICMNIMAPLPRYEKAAILAIQLDRL